jgi:hypothetical protein
MNMGRRLIWLVVCAAAFTGPGCQKSPSSPARSAAVPASGGGNQAAPAQGVLDQPTEKPARPKTVEEARAESDNDRLGWKYEDDGTKKSAEDYRLLSKAERDAIDELRALVRKRPLVEMSAAQRKLLERDEKYFKDRSFGRYFLELSDRDGGWELVDLLKLNEYSVFNFRVQYAKEEPGRRQTVRAAIIKAARQGFDPLTDEERAALRPYKSELSELPDQPAK